MFRRTNCGVIYTVRIKYSDQIYTNSNNQRRTGKHKPPECFQLSKIQFLIEKNSEFYIIIFCYLIILLDFMS